ncbi:MAG: hypothetical protein F6K59_17845 [Moorea sp. SIO3F7]|nr:hypothetical protein [Moorena sp. SIO3F7]
MILRLLTSVETARPVTHHRVKLPVPDSRLPTTPYSLSSIMINKSKNNYQYHAGLVSNLGNF